MKRSATWILSLASAVAVGLPAPARADVQVSSFLTVPDKPSSTFNGHNLVDGNPATVWVEGKEGPGLGENVVIDLPRCTIKRVDIMPGHGLDARNFGRYSHVKELELEFFTLKDDRSLSSVKKWTVTLEDAFKQQSIPVEGVAVGDELFGGQLKLTVKSVYPGKDFQDTAIGELMVVLAEFPAQLELTTGPAPQKGIESEFLSDGSAKTAWITAAPSDKTPLVLNAAEFGMTALLFTQSAVDPKKGKELARPKEITISVGGETVKASLADTPGAQRIDLPSRKGFSGAVYGTVTITIESVWPGLKSQQLTIGDIQLVATHLNL